MNSYPGYIAFFEDVASRLTLLGQEAGKTNLFFVDSPEQANVLLSAIKTKLTLPALLVEFYDEDSEKRDTTNSTLSGAFVVLQQAEKRHIGHDHIRTAIYESAKPAADQILAFMRKKADRMELTIDGKPVTMDPQSQGSWVGPLHNDLYGYSYQFTWRISGGACYDATKWTS